MKILAAVVPFDPTTETSKRKKIPRERLKTLEDNGLVLDLDNAKGTYGVASDLCTNAFELLNSIPEARHEVDDRILDWLLSMYTQFLSHSVFIYTVKSLHPMFLCASVSRNRSLCFFDPRRTGEAAYVVFVRLSYCL